MENPFTRYMARVAPALMRPEMFEAMRTDPGRAAQLFAAAGIEPPTTQTLEQIALQTEGERSGRAESLDNALAEFDPGGPEPDPLEAIIDPDTGPRAIVNRTRDSGARPVMEAQTRDGWVYHPRAGWVPDPGYSARMPRGEDPSPVIAPQENPNAIPPPAAAPAPAPVEGPAQAPMAAMAAGASVPAGLSDRFADAFMEDPMVPPPRKTQGITKTEPSPNDLAEILSGIQAPEAPEIPYLGAPAAPRPTQAFPTGGLMELLQLIGAQKPAGTLAGAIRR